MKPSSLSTWAMRCLSLVDGMSTAGDSMRFALRIRVSMSAMGSVSMMGNSCTEPFLAEVSTRRHGYLPARFLDAGDQALQGHVPEANAAHAELAVDGARPAAQPAAHADADPVARPELLGLGRVALGGVELGQVAVELDEMSFGGHQSFSRAQGLQPLGLGVYASRKGMPKSRRSSRASSSLLVLVTKVMSMPCVKVTLSGSISGKTSCSARPRL